MEKMRHESCDNLKINKMLKAYNKQKKWTDTKKENRKTSKEKEIKENENIKKDENQTAKSENENHENEQKKNEFKDSIRVETKKNSKMDKTIYEFKEALIERKEYEKELKEKGAREVKALKKTSYDKEL